MTVADWAAMMQDVNGVFTVRVWGEIDLANAHRFREYLLGAVSMAHDGVVVDLCGVRHLDSSAVHALVAARAAADLREVRFEVAADGLTRKVIDLVGLTSLLRDVPEPAA